MEYTIIFHGIDRFSVDCLLKICKQATEIVIIGFSVASATQWNKIPNKWTFSSERPFKCSKSHDLLLKFK